MDDFLAGMIETSDNCSTLPLHKLLNSYQSENKNHIYIFIEGKTDKPFYSNKIDPIVDLCGCSAEYKKCGDKKSVKVVYDITKSNSYYDQRRLFFIMDRDLAVTGDDFIVNDVNVYTTECYSYENDVVTKETFKAALVDLSTIDEEIDKESINAAVEDYNNSYHKFIDMLQIIMSTMIYWRRNDVYNKGSKKFKISKKLNINNNSVSWNCCSDILPIFYEMCNADYSNHDPDIVNDIMKEIERKSLKEKIVKGHYLASFFIKYWNQLSIDVNRDGKQTSIVPQQINETNFNNTIAIKAKSPDSLKSFINNVIYKNCSDLVK